MVDFDFDAIDQAERIAELIELDRLDDASQGFFDSDWRGVLIKAMNDQQPRHLSNPPYRLLSGLLNALNQMSPNHPRCPADPKKIRSYCRDIRRQVPGADPAPPEEILAELTRQQRKILGWLWLNPTTTTKDLQEQVWAPKVVEPASIIRAIERLQEALLDLDCTHTIETPGDDYVVFHRSDR